MQFLHSEQVRLLSSVIADGADAKRLLCVACKMSLLSRLTSTDREAVSTLAYSVLFPVMRKLTT